jgi:hypothetical protein
MLVLVSTVRDSLPYFTLLRLYEPSICVLDDGQSFGSGKMLLAFVITVIILSDSGSVHDHT